VLLRAYSILNHSETYTYHVQLAKEKL